MRSCWWEAAGEELLLRSCYWGGCHWRAAEICCGRCLWEAVGEELLVGSCCETLLLGAAVGGKLVGAVSEELLLGAAVAELLVGS